MDSLDLLFDAAVKSQQNAYAPYSKFQVGAAIQTQNGTIYSGGNVENASYPVGVCAEASAISAMVNAGERAISAIVVMGEGAELVTPCGACRQRIFEFSIATTRIHIAGPEGIRRSFCLEELLPHAFGPGHLKAE
jgi:cytidine deaminase